VDGTGVGDDVGATRRPDCAVITDAKNTNKMSDPTDLIYKPPLAELNVMPWAEHRVSYIVRIIGAIVTPFFSSAERIERANRTACSPSPCRHMVSARTGMTVPSVVVTAASHTI